MDLQVPIQKIAAPKGNITLAATMFGVISMISLVAG
jgi:hypothetical protein